MEAQAPLRQLSLAAVLAVKVGLQKISFQAVNPGRDWLAPPFLLDSVSRIWDIRVDMVEAEKLPRPEGLRLFNGSEQEGLWLAEEEDRVFLRSYDFAVSLDLRAKTGEAQIASSQAWQNVLRLIYFFDFLDRGGLLLHASSLVHKEQAYVFPGRSGAGKTTIVEHSAGKAVLNDELSLLIRAAAGAEVLAYGTPFFGDWNRPGEKLAAPVKGLYFPVQYRENRVLPLSPPETLNLLLPRVCAYTTWKPRLEKILDLALQLSRLLPGFSFHFMPTNDFWQVLDAS